MKNMKRQMKWVLSMATFACLMGMAGRAAADPFSFTTGPPDGRMATASRPDSPGHIETESADDFILPSSTVLTSATFTGLLPTGVSTGSILAVNVEIYRVFPLDSTNPPSGQVPTRVNSPSDVAFANRGTADGNLTFTVSVLNPAFVAANSVVNGIHPIPNQTTGGEGAVSGQEVIFSVTFTTPLSLPADHYFFIPQVLLANGNFLWLSAVQGQFVGDLQSWIRNGDLDPDWLRIGTDIVGGATPPRFNGSFSLQGETVPEPTSMVLLGTGLAGIGAAFRKRQNARKGE